MPIYRPSRRSCLLVAVAGAGRSGVVHACAPAEATRGLCLAPYYRYLPDLRVGHLAGKSANGYGRARTPVLRFAFPPSPSSKYLDCT